MDGKDISSLLLGTAKHVKATSKSKSNSKRKSNSNSNGDGNDDGSGDTDAGDGIEISSSHGMGEMLVSPHDDFMPHFCGETLAAARVLGARYKVHWSSGEVGKGVIGKASLSPSLSLSLSVSVCLSPHDLRRLLKPQILSRLPTSVSALVATVSLS